MLDSLKEYTALVRIFVQITWKVFRTIFSFYFTYLVGFEHVDTFSNAKDNIFTVFQQLCHMRLPVKIVYLYQFLLELSLLSSLLELIDQERSSEHH